MVKIRLTRRGKKNAAYYHIVAVDSRKKRDGAVLEHVGTYSPSKETAAEKITLDREAYNAWIAKGAQPTETVVQIVNSSSK